MQDLVNLEQLQQWLCYKSRQAVIKWLDENGVRWAPARNGDPVTTCAQINAALGMREEQVQEVEFNEPLQTFNQLTRWLCAHRNEIVVPTEQIIDDATTTITANAGVYFLVAHGAIQYIGQSFDITNRMIQHAWHGLTYVIEVNDDFARLAIEAAYIHALKPPRNAKIEVMNEPRMLVCEWIGDANEH